MNDLLKIDTNEEIKKITKFLRDTFNKQKIKYGVIGLSGGIDSSTSFALLIKAIGKENVIPVHLPYFDNDRDIADLLRSVHFPKDKLINISIEDMVETIGEELEVSEDDLIRRGNIMARVRMMVLYDLAKRINGLVVGTENRSEYRLGYYTRYGDEASDIEPIRHLYKTHVYSLAKSLAIPSSILKKQPSAGLWENQTDEEEFGFAYVDADPVLYLHFERKMKSEDIEKQGYKNAKKILDFVVKNSHKHEVPYSLG